MGRRRAVGEDMAEMAAAARAMHLGAAHAVTAVLGRFDRTIQRIVEARPAGAAFEFGLRPKQRLAAAGTGECAGAFLVIERAAVRRFGAMPAHHLILLGPQQAAPFLFGMGDWEVLLGHLKLRSNGLVARRAGVESHGDQRAAAEDEVDADEKTERPG